jgi:poly-gamma-glutamate capsule biosynthesis protein CapA/YwtB (metallophosphatase superfamily)
LLEDADVVLLNVEGAIGEGPVSREKCRPGSRSCYAFRMPPAAAGAFSNVAPQARVIGNVANNHARDAGWDGLADTRRRLEAEGVAVTGMDTVATPVATAAGDTIAFLGYSTSGGPDPRDLNAVRRHVSRAAERWPRVVVTMHMGGEGIAAQRTPNDTEMFLGIDRGNLVAFSRAAADAGAGLVVGHGPHVMRAVEWWGESLIAYSLGNLVTYGPFSMGEPLNRGGLLCADLDAAGRVVDATLRSTWQRSAGIVAHDPTARAAALADSLGALDFPETAARFRTESRIRRPEAR